MQSDVDAYRLGMFAWYGYDQSIQERVRIIAEAGFNTTCFWLGIDEYLFASGRSCQLPAVIRDYGLEIENVHIPYDRCNDIWSEDAKVRAELMRMYMCSLEYCSMYEIPIMVMHITRGAKPPSPNTRGTQFLMDLTEKAANLGVKIAIENTASNDHIDSILDKIDSAYIGLCYDSSHDFLRGKPFCGILRKWGHRLFTTHISDNDGLNDRHWIIGKGKLNWDVFIKSFPKSSYGGVLSCEVLPQDTDPIEEFVKAAYDRMNLLSHQLVDK